MQQEDPIPSASLLAEGEGVFQLAGSEPAWFCAYTCSTRNCGCRNAVIVATSAGRDVLLALAAPVREAWTTKRNYTAAAAELEGAVAFVLDIDTGGVFAPLADELMDLEQHPPTRAVVERIDGDLLEEIGRLWYRGKGQQDPEITGRPARLLKGYSPGDMLTWEEAYTGVREDLYSFDHLPGSPLYGAQEYYCPVPGCTCGKILIDFVPLVPRGLPAPGKVVVAGDGKITLEPSSNKQREQLARLWMAFRKRYPRYEARLARRYTRMKEYGESLAPQPAAVTAAPKIGRNEPCPCGSGKKYKRCCAP